MKNKGNIKKVSCNQFQETYLSLCALIYAILANSTDLGLQSSLHYIKRGCK